MAATKTSKNKKKLSRKKAKKLSPKQRPTYAELRQQLAEALQREQSRATGISTRELADALERQSEVLSAITSGAVEIQPVLDLIVQNAARVCAVDDVLLRVVQNGSLIPRAHFGPLPTRRVELSIDDEPQFSWMRDHGTLHIPDVSAQTEFPRLGSGSGFLGFLGAPLRQGGRFIGALLARRLTAKPFTSEQIKLLEMFADQSVIAIENARLFQEHQSRNRELAALHEVTTAASQSLEIKPVLDEVVRKITEIFHFDAVRIFLYDADTETMNLTALFGLPQVQTSPTTLRRGRGVTGWVAETGKYIIFEDVRSDSRYRQMSQSNSMEQLGTCFFALFPIKSKQRFLGTINCIGKEARHLSSDEVSLITSMADQIGVALENLSLFEEVKNKTKELERSNAELREALEHQTATSEVLGIISRSPTDVQPVLDAIVESAAKVCGTDDVVLRLRMADVMSLRAHFGPLTLAPVDISIDEPEYRWICEHGTLHLADVEAQRDEFPNLGLRTRFRTFLATPLRQQDEVIGSLNARRLEVRPFTPAQIKLLETFASQAVIALENVRLFQELKESLEQQTATSEILGVIASSPTDLQPVLNTVAENAAQLCEATDALIHRTDGDTLKPVANYGPLPGQFDRDGVPVVRGSIPGRAVIERQTIHIHDLNAVPEHDLAARFARTVGVRTVVVTPLIREGMPIGTIQIRRTEVRPFTEKQIKLLETFASQAVIAIENVRLFKEIQERNAELREALEHQTATSEVLSIISRSPTDVQPVLDAIVESSARVCGIDDLVLRLREGNLMVARAHVGSIPIPSSRVEMSIDDTRFQWLRERGTLHIPDRREQDLIPIVGSVSEWRSWLGVPLRHQGELIGGLFARRIEARPFTPPQIKLVETFADQAVIALENVRLFNELKESLEQQTATSEILGVIASSPTDIQPVLDSVAEHAARLCDASDALILRVNGNSQERVASYGSMPVLETTSNLTTPGTPAGRAILDRETIHVHDLAASDADFPDAQNRGVAMGVRTALVAPLLREGVAIGAVYIRRKEVRPFSDRQIKLLETFADQAVIAIENVRLFQELKESLEQQTATNEILGVIASSPTDIQPVLDTVAENAARITASDDAVIYRVHDDNLIRAAKYGVHEWGPLGEIGQRLSRGTPAGRAVIDRQVIHVADLLAAPSEFPDVRRHVQYGSRTVLSTPLLREGVPIGVIHIRRTEVKPFTDKQITLLKTFAAQAVIAIENVRLFKEIQERNAELREALEHQTATSEVLGIISRSPTDVQPVLDAIVESAARVCGIDDVLLRLREANTMVPRAHFGSIRIVRVQISIDEPQFCWMREHGTLHISNVREQNDFPMLSSIDGFHTYLGAPLRQQGEFIGGLFARRSEVRPFTPAQIKLLETFADQAVIAIENVRLFNELKESLEQQTATSEILGVIASSPTDIQPVLNAVAASAARVCSAEDGTIFRLEGDVLRLAARHGMLRLSTLAQEKGVNVSRATVSGRSVVDRKTVHVHDLSAELETEFPDSRPYQEEVGWKTTLATPLLRESVPIGVIHIRRMEVRPFSDKQIKLLETFASQAVIAIENVRLFKEIQERNAELREALEHQTATSEVLGIISRSPTDVQPVLDAIVESAARVCGVDDVVLRLRDGNAMLQRAHFGPIPLSGVEISIDDPRHLWMREHGTLHVPDIRAQNISPQLGIAGDRWRTYLAAPLHLHGELIGTLGARRIEVRPFTATQIKLLETFADQAVIAIENVRLFTELQSRTRELAQSVGELRALGEVGQAVSSTLDLETVLTRIVSHAVQLSATDGGAIYEYDEQSEEFQLRATDHMEEELINALRTNPPRLGDGLVGKAALSRQPIEVADISQELAYPPRMRQMLSRHGFKASLAVPLLREDHIVGALVIRRKATGSFRPEVVELLKTFATQSVLAIQNARLFREIENKSREIEAANRHKSEFLANMSHELRTPLTAIIGFSEVLSDKIFGELNGKQDEYIGDIVSSGRHLLSLINDILDLSKVEAGRMDLDVTKFDVPMAIENALILMRERATRHGIKVQHHIDDQLGEIMGDERKFKQILLNLLSNAVKFTPEGGRIDVDAGLSKDSIEISVSDTGIGIAPEHQETIFEEFRQVGTDASKKREGTGLGLALTKRFVELHGGIIRVESVLSKGSTFTFTLPLNLENVDGPGINPDR